MALLSSRKGKIFGGVMFAFFIAFLLTDNPADTATSGPTVVAPVQAVSPPPDTVAQPTPAEVATTETERLAAAADRANNERYGVYCLSLWDGSHEHFVEAVKEAINDPDSFEHDATKTWPVNAEGRNIIVMNFRARNALGGMVQVKAAGSFDNDSCSDIRIDLIE